MVTREPICLDNTDPVLLEKVLGFLYTGNYTVGRLIPEAQDPQLDSDTECAKESLITSISKVQAPNQLASEVEEATDEITIHSSENTISRVQEIKHGGSHDRRAFPLLCLAIPMFTYSVHVRYITCRITNNRAAWILCWSRVGGEDATTTGQCGNPSGAS
jgi:hypothetical protein